MLRDEINTALKGAMKARDERRVSALRLVNAAIQNADIEAETGKKSALSDDDLLALLQKLIKQRQEAAEVYEKAGRRGHCRTNERIRSTSYLHRSDAECTGHQTRGRRKATRFRCSAQWCDVAALRPVTSPCRSCKQLAGARVVRT